MDQAEDILWIPKDIAEDGDALVRAVDDSMNLDGIYAGFVLVVKWQDTAKPGQWVLAEIPYQGTTCRRLVAREDGLFLVANSRAAGWPPVMVGGDVRIVGVVRHVWHYRSAPKGNSAKACEAAPQ